jgi:hypothetical protein
VLGTSSVAVRRARTVLAVLLTLGCVVLSVRLDDAGLIHKRGAALREPAVKVVLGELYTAALARPTYHGHVTPRYGSAQQQTMALVDPLFGDRTRAVANARCATGDVVAPRNVVFVVMESTGARYAFKELKKGVMPMPMLSALRKKGMFLSRHLSTSNSSHNSIFSIFSGLYPLPRPEPLSMANDLSVPSLFSLLGPDYDSFVVSPGSLKWYFPYAFLKNTGVKELWGRDNIQIDAPRKGPPGGLNELDTVDFFLERLARAEPPFAAVYYSFAPHHPYQNPGAPYDIVPATSEQNRYYNAMSMLDAQIDRIVKGVYEKSDPRDTLIVLVGDHGEAFGQHRGNKIHGSHSYMENVHTLALLVHPDLPAHTSVEYTSHVDLLPTVLDALCVPYEPGLLQGRSLLGPPIDRDYVYVYGSEHAITSVSHAGRKLSFRNKTGERWAFDLARDPREKKMLKVASEDPQLISTLQFQRFQTDALLRYKRQTVAGKSRGKLAHPSRQPRHASVLPQGPVHHAARAAP